MVSFFSQQRSVFLWALVALTVLVAVPPGGLHVAAQTDDSILESTMEPTMGATDPIVAPPEDDDEPRDSALDCSPELLGDGQCDDEFNTEACEYDGGDCCECTCEPDMFNCGGNYNCIDPDAACVEDDDGDGGVLTTADLEDDIVPGVATDADSSAPGISSWSSVSTGVAAAASAAALFAGFAL